MPLPLNTITVFNAAPSFRLGWEGKFRTLEAQAEASLDNPGIMGIGVADAVRTLAADPETVRQFQAAYGRPPDSAALLDAIARAPCGGSDGNRFDERAAGQGYRRSLVPPA